jgi:hypothetical protein
VLSKDVKIQKLVLSVVSYGYETWPFTLREQCTLRVSENRVLRRILRSKRDECHEA